MNARLLPASRPVDLAWAHDRRQTERKLWRVSGLFHVAGYPPMRVKTIDLSTKGVALLLPKALPQQTVGNLSFHVHVNGLVRQIVVKVEISNSVFRHSDVRVGCRFLFLKEETRTILAAFLR